MAYYWVGGRPLAWHAGLNSFLFRKCGGVNFLKGFFGALEGLLVRAPDGKGDYETAMENYYIAASIGANADLKDFFTGVALVWPKSKNSQETFIA